jgi:hypothetical protein
MANYITIGSRFKPFSYAEMLQPVRSATQAHQELETQYSELASKANVWDNLADAQREPEAYSMYKRYADDLRAQADMLAQQGLTPASRQSLLDMKNRYSSEIIPIEQAYASRKGLIDAQRKHKEQDNTVIFDVDASTLSLDDFIRNPQLTYRPYSGAMISKQVSNAAHNLAREIRNNPRQWKKTMEGQYWQTMEQKGYTAQEILLAALNDDNAPEPLKKIVEDAIDASDIRSWNNNQALDQAYRYARLGLLDAIGDVRYDVQANRDFIPGSAGSGNTTPDIGNPFYRTMDTNIVNPEVETSKLQEQINDLNALMANPDLLNTEDSLYTGIYGNMAINPPSAPIYGFYNAPFTYNINDDEDIDYNEDLQMIGPGLLKKDNKYKRLISKLSKEYGDIHLNTENGRVSKTNIPEIIDKLQKKIKSSVVRSKVYMPNITDSSLIIQGIEENIRALPGEESGLHKIEDGVKGKKIKKDDAYKYLKDGNIYYTPDLGIVVTSRDNKGKVNKAVLDIGIIDDAGKTLDKYHKTINRSLERGEPESATLMIHGYTDGDGYHPGLMETLYHKFNNLKQRLGNTTSKP